MVNFKLARDTKIITSSTVESIHICHFVMCYILNKKKNKLCAKVIRLGTMYKQKSHITKNIYVKYEKSLLTVENLSAKL